ncbi:serine/threonine protein kinase, partial [Pseudohyphozyma bogoriensis]
RNPSGGSSVTHHSSSSSIGAEDVAVDEQKNEDPIIEEDETVEGDVTISGTGSSTVPEDRDEERTSEERAKALRKLSGEFEPIKSELRHQNSSTSRLSMDSHHSSSSSKHAPVIFTAHKTRHVFGAPSQPAASHTHAHSISRKSSHGTIRPPIRDVFAAKGEDRDWVDEQDDLGGYGGGLGQPSTRASGHRVSESVSSTSSSLFSVGSSDGTGTIPSSATSVSGRDSGDYESGGGGSSFLFEGRYAGVAAAQGTPPPDGGSWRSTQGSRGPAFRSAIVIEEEEEEEEE